MAHLMVSPKRQFFDSNGNPLSGGKVYTYEAGTSTPLATYTDKGAGTANSNPIILDSRGEADIWLSSSAYKISVYDSDDNLIYTVDDVSIVNDGSITTAMIADSAITTAKINDGAVTAAKLASSLGANGVSAEKEDDYTVTSTDDIILINAISNDVAISLPQASTASGQIVTIKRIDATIPVSQTFADGDVTVSTENINISSHGFTQNQRVRLTTTGALPTGLATGTDYYIIYVDANNIKLASSKANSKLGTAVDITAASGGGTHTVASQYNDATVDGYLTETIDGATTLNLYNKYESCKVYCDGSEWLCIVEPSSGYKVGDSVIDSTGLAATTLTNVTNAVIEFNSHGKPVEVGIMPEAFYDAGGSGDGIIGSDNTETNASFTYAITRDGTQIHQAQITSISGVGMILPSSILRYVDKDATGTHTYRVQFKTSSASITGQIIQSRMYARRL